jgi:hypothetical protein
LNPSRPTQNAEYADFEVQVPAGCNHEADTLVKVAPVAAYPDQFVEYRPLSPTSGRCKIELPPAVEIGVTAPQIRGTEAMANRAKCLTLIGLTSVASLLCPFGQ